ncbi:PepSY domain-containing protein [Paracoccus sp. (in: a-proteobacteria)]|uniref:PepSY domain-containing protein n=1 Tax=Paracoccus sp. TaxID=267 RepID=UPI00321FD21D
MMRIIHRWPGLLALVLVCVLALSGAALSLFPALDALSTPGADAGLSLAELAARVQTEHPGVEQIRASASGRITAYWFEGDAPAAAVIDPATGQGIAPADRSPVARWLSRLHRSLFLGESGRIAMAVGAAAMLVLSLSGAVLVTRRMGGWRRWLQPMRGTLASRLHVEIARLSVPGLVLSSATALWMVASGHDLLPDAAQGPAFPVAVSGQTGYPLAGMAVLAETPVAALRELSFPAPQDASDVFTLKTDLGSGYLDQGTGQLLAWVDATAWERASRLVFVLHTGRGAALLGLVLGLMSLGVPAMAGTGVVMWWGARRARPRIRGNVPAARADTVLLVGSEGGSTWGFAATLHAALTRAGQAVHVAPMSGFDPARHTRAAQVVLLAATYGDGAAPASARGFLERLAAMKSPPAARLAVLGFGDRSFPAYCRFARQVARRAEAAGWRQMIAFDSVDRQSPQDFARWGRALGKEMGLALDLVHQPVLPAVQALRLLSRRDYGAEVAAPSAILRFALPREPLWRRLCGRGFGRFQPGDLLGILPEGAAMPRFYSLASGRRHGFVEIVVKHHPGGLCSGQLIALRPGQTVRAFLRRNPGFHADRGRQPLILIGAGCGVGPLAGFVRDNRQQRPIHLFFGMRRGDSDFLYDRELATWQGESRLRRLVTACSRGEQPQYVQDALRREAVEVAGLIRGGARVMVCGGRQMAQGVSEALAEILAPSGLTPALLKAEGRYVEDLF